jgi:putative ABC transport system substrate-binding protein
MRRRDIVALIGAGVLVGHGAAAQQLDRTRRVGVLIAWPEDSSLARAAATGFSEALARAGWIDGRNIRIEYRYAAGDPARFKAYAAELVALSPDALVASLTPGLAALREQTQKIPIVFVLVADPVGQGFVQSLAKPGGNITGFSSLDTALFGKWLELLKEVAPSLKRVTVIADPATSPAALYNAGIAPAAASLGIDATFAEVHDLAAVETAMVAEARLPGGGLITAPGGFTQSRAPAIAAMALRYRLPLIGAFGVPEAGGLMSYFFDTPDLYRQAAEYIDRILKGAKPADLPVQQPIKFEFVINMKTAKALGLTVPPLLLARADNVIE